MQGDKETAPGGTADIDTRRRYSASLIALGSASLFAGHEADRGIWNRYCRRELREVDRSYILEMTGSPIGTADSIMLNALMHPSWVAEMALMSADMVRDNESFLRLISAYNLHSSCSRVVVISERVRRGEDIDVVMTSTPHDRATPAMNGLMYGLLIALLDFGRRTTNAQRSNYEWSVMCDVAAKVDSVDIPSALRAGVMFAEYGRAMHLPKRASISLLRKVERRMKPKGTITK